MFNLPVYDKDPEWLNEEEDIVSMDVLSYYTNEIFAEAYVNLSPDERDRLVTALSTLNDFIVEAINKNYVILMT